MGKYPSKLEETASSQSLTASNEVKSIKVCKGHLKVPRKRLSFTILPFYNGYGALLPFLGHNICQFADYS